MIIVSYLAAIACLICWIMVLIKMFPAEGTLKGILAIICGLYAFIWGWMNATKFNLKNIMLIWTIALIVSIAMNFMGAPIYPR
jgi:ABC-type antimicrobial peptide transport system permease subunit